MEIIDPHRFGTRAQAFDGFGNASRSFDGVDDYVTIPDADVFSFTDGLGNDEAFSISLWFKSTASPSAQNLITKGSFAGTTNKEWQFQILGGGNAGKLAITIFDDDATNQIYIIGSTVYTINTWHHAVITYDGSGSDTGLTIYVDGSNDNGTNAEVGSYTGMGATSNDVGIGARYSSSWGVLFNGNLADVRIYDTDLSSTDIASLYNGTNITTNLIGHWLKDTPSLLDHAGNNDSINYGSSWSPDNPSPAVEFGDASRSFDGVGDYVDLGNSTEFSFSDGNNDEPFSLSTWVYIRDNSTFRILSKDNGVGSDREWLLATDSGGNLNIYLIDGGVFRGREYTTPLAENEWLHVSATYDGSGGTNFRLGLKLYVNGVQVDNVDFGSGDHVAMDVSTANNVYIGRYATTYSDGKFADVRIYDDELTSSEVLDLYNGNNHTDNLIGHWLTNNDDVNDYAGTNDGTNNGSTYSLDNPSDKVEYGGASRSFDGANQYVDLGDVDGSAWQGANKKFSGSLWMNLANTSGNKSFFNKAGNSSNQYEWTVTSIGANIRFAWAGSLNPTNNYWIEQTTDSPLVAGEWLHFTFTYDGTQALADRIKLYLNGAEANYSPSSAGTPSEIQNGNQPLCIGGEWQSNGAVTNDHNGKIADVRLYDDKLTSTEVYELYKGVDHRTNLIGQWLTNSDDVEDKAGTNDGTNYGSTYSTDSPL